MRTKTTKEVFKWFYDETWQNMIEILDPAFNSTENPKDWNKQKFKIREIFEEIAKKDTLKDDGTYWQFEGGFEAYQKYSELGNKLTAEICITSIKTYLKYNKEFNRKYLEMSDEYKQFNF